MTINEMHAEMKKNLRGINEAFMKIKYTKKENISLTEMRMKNFNEFFKYMDSAMLGKKSEITRLYNMSNVALKKITALA